MSSKIKVDTIETVAGSGNITISNPLSGSNIISTANITCLLYTSDAADDS